MNDRIAILLPNLAGGGAQHVSISLAAEFIGRGFEVDFVVLQAKGELIGRIPEGARVFDLDSHRIRTSLVPLVHYLRRERPRVLLAAMWPVTVVAVLASKWVRVPIQVIVSDHSTLSSTPQASGMSGRLLRASVRWVYPNANRVVAVSEGVRDDLHDLGLPLSVGVQVIHNPIRPASVSLSPDDSFVGGWIDATFRILAVGSLKPAKDYPTLLRAFREVVASHPQARLLILGEGPLRSELSELVDRLRLTESVKMPGFAPEPSSYYRHADLFVMSSAWEGFGNVIVEALSAGIPVVSTDCRSGPREILADGKYGRLVPVGDADALASAINESLTVEHDPEILRQRAHDFRPGVAAARYLELVAG